MVARWEPTTPRGYMEPVEPSKWEYRFMNLAKEFSTWSKDPSSQLGCVAVSPDRRILSQGYNGFPRGMSDAEELYDNRETKYKYIVHAEQNCIYNASLQGISLRDSILFIYGLPLCHECAKGVIQAGIKEVIMGFEATSERVEVWKESFKTTSLMLFSCNVDWKVIKT